jgi:hypothetical protein
MITNNSLLIRNFSYPIRGLRLTKLYKDLVQYKIKEVTSSLQTKQSRPLTPIIETIQSRLKKIAIRKTVSTAKLKKADELIVLKSLHEEKLKSYKIVERSSTLSDQKKDLLQQLKIELNFLTKLINELE